MGLLTDFLQGASNAAASNVSSPVDGIAWLLRKAGIDTGTPVMGSDWMAQKGFTAQPQNRNAGLLGEALGGVAPLLAAAKAPQIAGGLLQMGENAAAHQTMNKQAGKVFVYPQDEALATAQRNAAKPVSEGGLGLRPDNTPMERAKAMGMDIADPQVHFSRHGVDVSELDSGKYAMSPFDAVGTHVGTPAAALERMQNTVGTTDQIKGVTYPVFVKKQNAFTDAGAVWDEDALSNKLRQMGGHNWSDMNGGKQTYPEMNAALRQKLFGEFDAIPYTNQVESKGSTSWVVPPKNIRSRFAAFDPARRNEADILGRADPALLSILAGAGLLGVGAYEASK